MLKSRITTDSTGKPVIIFINKGPPRPFEIICREGAEPEIVFPVKA